MGLHGHGHTAAVHLLEAGVEVNVIRGWLGHTDLTTTNRYAEISTKTKLAALRATELSDVGSGEAAEWYSATSARPSELLVRFSRKQLSPGVALSGGSSVPCSGSAAAG